MAVGPDKLGTKKLTEKELEIIRKIEQEVDEEIQDIADINQKVITIVLQTYIADFNRRLKNELELKYKKAGWRYVDFIAEQQVDDGQGRYWDKNKIILKQ